MEIEQLRLEVERLREENRRLREELSSIHGKAGNQTEGSLPQSSAAATVSRNSGVEEKIALFRSLFRGREDVYAVRWKSKTGRGGYSPARVRGTGKSTAGVGSGLLPLNDRAIFDHLAGRQTVGVYPLLKDETCWFLAVDFDKAGWAEDITAFLSTCREFGLRAAIERSRSGKGGHAWFFFESPVAASTARKMGCALLTHTMERRHQLGLDSYDRLFPSQDTMPKGGFGNLIALPLQGEPRRRGNTLFLDHNLQPYPDQWAFLSGSVAREIKCLPGRRRICRTNRRWEKETDRRDRCGHDPKSEQKREG